MNASLILGCHGARRYGFCLCKGISNPIIHLSKLGKYKEETIEYLDTTHKLFDRVITDLNQINSIIRFIHENRQMPDHINNLIYDFLALHKTCGFYMYIESGDL